MRIVVAAALLAGCSDGHHVGTFDAVPDADLLHCPAPADPTAPGMHTVFLNFDGVTLTKGNCDDAPTNCTALVTNDPTVVPPFLDANPDRTDDIPAIVNLVKTAVAPYSIEIVTTRPAAAPYDMIVIGGAPALIGAGNGTLGVAPGTCTPTHHSLSLDFDHGYSAPYLYANDILSDIGIFAGLGLSSDPGDCMCRAAMGCQVSNAQVCTYSRAGNVDATFACGHSTPHDEQAELDVVYACR